jgi:hypothetical protein
MTRDDLNLYLESSRRDSDSFEELLARISLIADSSYRSRWGVAKSVVFHVKHYICIASIERDHRIGACML